jgi:hypothetical protein
LAEPDYIVIKITFEATKRAVVYQPEFISDESQQVPVMGDDDQATTIGLKRE